MNAPALRPLRIGEILDASIKIYMSNARTLIGLAAVVVVPVQILSAVVLLSIIPNTGALPSGFGAMSSSTTTTTDQAATTGANLTVTVMGALAALFVTAACTRAVSDVYLDQPSTFRSAARFAARRLHSLLWVGLLTWVGAGLALLAFIVPGVYLWTVWAVAIPVLVIEGTKGRRALGRSRALVQGRWWPTFGLILIATLLASVVTGILQGAMLAIFLTTSDSLVLGVALITLAGTIASIVVRPFQAAVTTVLYYDLRVRKEGYDVELLAEQLGLEPAVLPRSGYLGPESVGQPGGPPYWPPPPGWSPPEGTPSPLA